METWRTGIQVLELQSRRRHNESNQNGQNLPMFTHFHDVSFLAPWVICYGFFLSYSFLVAIYLAIPGVRCVFTSRFMDPASMVKMMIDWKAGHVECLVLCPWFFEGKTLEF